MITDERLAVLHGQVANKGYHRHTLDRMAREGVPLGEHGTVIAVTVNELHTLLTIYQSNKENDMDHAAEKKPYEAPALTNLGKLTDLTASGSGNANEGNEGRGQGDVRRPSN